MTWMQFVAALTDSLAWPTALVAVAVIFRPAIVRFIDRVQLKRIAAKGIEAEFDQVLAEIKEKISIESLEAPGEITRPVEPDRDVHDVDEALVQFAPIGAIVTAWREVEAKLNDAIAASGTPADVRRPRSANVAAELLLKNGVITPTTRENIKGLSLLRNLAVHGREDDAWFSPDRAREFVNFAQMMQWSIEHDLARFLDKRGESTEPNRKK